MMWIIPDAWGIRFKKSQELVFIIFAKSLHMMWIIPDAWGIRFKKSQDEM
jgi:hypothetical protein